MSSSVVFNSLGRFMNELAFLPFENIGNIFNYSLIGLGFIGLFYWLNLQRKFNAEAAKTPGKLK